MPDAIDDPSLFSNPSHLKNNLKSRQSLQPSKHSSVGSQGELTSYVTAIAQPRMIDAWSPIKKFNPSPIKLFNVNSAKMLSN